MAQLTVPARVSQGMRKYFHIHGPEPSRQIQRLYYYSLTGVGALFDYTIVNSLPAPEVDLFDQGVSNSACAAGLMVSQHQYQFVGSKY